jgi:hypothetical protein
MMKAIASMVLLLCLSLSIVPFGLFHAHDEGAEICRPNDPGFEEDICHISLYHSSENGSAPCDHGQHLDVAHFSCEICKYFSSCTPSCIPVQKGTITAVLFAELLFPCTEAFIISSFYQEIFDRGPPVLA